MKYLKGLNWFLVAITFSGTVAADLVIDNQSIPGSEIQSITISPTSGDVFITTINGYVVTPSDAEPTPSGAVAITGFVASPSIILEGQSTLISWQTQDANTCTALGGTGGWASASVATSGSKSIAIATAGSYVFTLECTGDSGSVQSQVSVTVNEAVSVPDNCDPAPLSGITTDWAGYWGTSFPGPVYQDKTTEVPRNGYVAIQFNSADYVDTGLITTIETTATNGRRLGSISQCPGDFDVADECQQTWGVGGEIIWSTQGYSRACILQPNTTYYFNITYTDGVDPSSTECTSSRCLTVVRAKNP